MSPSRPPSVLPVLAVAAATAVLASSVPARAQALQATLVQGGFTQPVFLGAPAGDLQRLFVVEQGG